MKSLQAPVRRLRARNACDTHKKGSTASCSWPYTGHALLRLDEAPRTSNGTLARPYPLPVPIAAQHLGTQMLMCISSLFIRLRL